MTYEQMLAIPDKHRMTGMVVHTDRGLYQLQNKLDNTAWVEVKHNPIYKTPAPASRFKMFKTSHGYLARIINGKLVRVARVSVAGVDYNFETN